ncbi:hypothetical protein CANCADRAFT_89081 [Tortispora caseinolytica NRRL Y-17796]|uniref:rRNA adenine N(6)-methyltransferase n=1 Tax=Tortispora caseinolytica NRRL Y-17796 TaxID=767744 RepID=A0A1E4TLE6_9ASCO|nr:hypothetical protein CANCADRAFT_89081 [Tortispora caseinolytica NRRL Y-17796]
MSARLPRFNELSNVLKRSHISAYTRINITDSDLVVRALERSGSLNGYGRDTIVLDAYPSYGYVSQAVHDMLRPRKHVLLDIYPQVYKVLQEMVVPQDPTSYDLRPLDPYKWSTFDHLWTEEGMKPQKMPFGPEFNKEMLFIANLTGSGGTQLLSQYINCIGYRNWIFQFGRVKMLFAITPREAKLLFSTPGSTRRTRLSAIAYTVADIKPVLVTEPLRKDCDYGDGDPVEVSEEEFGDAFYPKKSGAVLIAVEPKENMLVEASDWYSYHLFVRNLFATRATPLIKCLRGLSPGALEPLYPVLKDEVDYETTRPVDLTAEQLARLHRAYEDWPFKPKNVMWSAFMEDFAEAEHTLVSQPGIIGPAADDTERSSS